MDDLEVRQQLIQMGPDGFIDGLPVGMNITGNNYEDQKVLNIAAAIEGLMDYKDQIAREVNR